MHNEVTEGGIAGGIDDGGADLHRLVNPHSCNLLDAFGESVHRNGPQTGRGGVLVDADQDRSAVQSERSDVFG